MSAVLVTGATGSLGSSLVRELLDRGEQVVALAAPGEGLGGLETVRADLAVKAGDVRDRAAMDRAMRGVDRVYHLAGIAAPLNVLHDRMVAVNVQGARTVAMSAAAADVSKLVHTSSISAIGYPPLGEVADEHFDIRRSVCSNSYAITKRAGEEAVLAVAEESGLDVTVINPSAVVAPYSDRKSGWAGLVELARRGRLKAYPSGGLALCAVADFVAGAQAAMQRGIPRRRYILSTTNLTYAAFFALVCDVVGMPPPRQRLPDRLVRTLAATGRAATAWAAEPSPLVARESVDLMVNRLYYDASRAQRELGFAPTELRTSITNVHDWLSRGTPHDSQRPTFPAWRHLGGARPADPRRPSS